MEYTFIKYVFLCIMMKTEIDKYINCRMPFLRVTKTGRVFTNYLFKDSLFRVTVQENCSAIFAA